MINSVDLMKFVRTYDGALNFGVLTPAPDYEYHNSLKQDDNDYSGDCDVEHPWLLA